MTFQITIPIYNQKVIVVVGKSDWSKYLKDTFNYDLTIANQDAMSLNIYGHEVILLPSKFNLSILIHEISHVVLDIVDTFGLLLEDQEAICYLQEYIFTQLCTILSIPMEVINLQ